MLENWKYAQFLCGGRPGDGDGIAEVEISKQKEKSV